MDKAEMLDALTTHSRNERRRSLFSAFVVIPASAAAIVAVLLGVAYLIFLMYR
jgi:hypothetical protein